MSAIKKVTQPIIKYLPMVVIKWESAAVTEELYHWVYLFRTHTGHVILYQS
jgi:hypothetical protein